MRSPTGLAQNWSSKSCLSRMSRSVMMPCSGPSISVTCNAPTPCACIIFNALLSEASGGRLRAGFDATAPAVTSARRAIQRASLAGPPSPNACATLDSMGNTRGGARFLRRESILAQKRHPQKKAPLRGFHPSGQARRSQTGPLFTTFSNGTRLMFSQCASGKIPHACNSARSACPQPHVLQEGSVAPSGDGHSAAPCTPPPRPVRARARDCPERHRVPVAGRTLRCRRVSCCPFPLVVS